MSAGSELSDTNICLSHEASQVILYSFQVSSAVRQVDKKVTESNDKNTMAPPQIYAEDLLRCRTWSFNSGTGKHSHDHSLSLWLKK